MMERKTSLDRVFRALGPALSVLLSLVSFAVIFDTFSVGAVEALYNLLLLLPLLGLCLMLTRRFHIAAIAASALAFALMYADAVVCAARLTHIRFGDFALLGQAARVAGRYSLIWSMELTRRALIAAALCAFLCFLVRYYGLRYAKKTVFLVGAGMLAVGVAVFFSGVLPHESEGFDFTAQSEEKGLLYAWYCQYHESRLTEPEGYSKERAEAILAEYAPTEGDGGVSLIVIMNESLTDYSLLGETAFADPLPNLHSYRDNCFYGKLAVSVFGGGTCNTEYEFLTGNAMAFLPDDSMPYLQYVLDEENSLARDLSALGYRSTAVHPYYSEEWNRTQVYRFLGFDSFVSGVDFGNAVVTNGNRATGFLNEDLSDNLISFGEGPLYVRGLISDQSCFERVLEESGERSFVFAVTMQNHGGYEYAGDDFVSTEYVTDADRVTEKTGSAVRRKVVLGLNGGSTENETYKVNQFLTCTSLSDAAFKALTDALEQRERKTVVLMFGDHQPALRVPEDYMSIDGFDDAMYCDVPYILWANFDLEFDAPEYTSPNYLSAILKKNAGLPLTAWDRFRLDVMEEYPVVTLNYILDRDGQPVEKEALRDYACVQYLRMFG